MDDAYKIPVAPPVNRHDLLRELPVLLAGDYEEDGAVKDGREFNVFDAMAASGDYFATMATRLDKVAQGLAQDSAEQIELEHLVTMMFYLQDRYDVVHKSKSRR